MRGYLFIRSDYEQDQPALNRINRSELRPGRCQGCGSMGPSQCRRFPGDEPALLDKNEKTPYNLW